MDAGTLKLSQRQATPHQQQHPPSGLPRIVRQGAEGTASTAPPLTTGVLGILRSTSMQCRLVIKYAPPPGAHEPGTMLLTAGDKLRFELVETEWIIRMEYLNPDCPEDVQRLRDAGKRPPAADANRANSRANRLPTHPRKAAPAPRTKDHGATIPTSAQARASSRRHREQRNRHSRAPTSTTAHAHTDTDPAAAATSLHR